MNTRFQQLTSEIRDELLGADMTASEWRLWAYLVTIDPFGDNGVDYNPEAAMSACKLKKSSYFAAKAKLQRLGWFDFKDGKTKVINLRGCKHLLNFPGVAVQDSGVAVQDSGVAVQDSGVAVQDSGVAVQDSGVAVQDSGVGKYIDRARGQTKDLNKTISDSPQRGDERESFGFQIPDQETTPSTLATLSKKSEVTQLTSQPVVEAIIPPAAPDPFFNKRVDPSRCVWSWLPDGPWKAEDGKLDSEFQASVASRWVKEYGGDLHAKKGDVLKHFKKDPANIAIEWEWYQEIFLHRAANIQTRKLAGMDTTADERSIIKQARAALPLPDEMRVTQAKTTHQVIEQVADYAFPLRVAAGIAATLEVVQPKQLESVTTVSDDIWDAIASEVKEQEKSWVNSIPEGATNPGMYAPVAKQDDAEYFRHLHEQSLTAVAQEPTNPVTSAEDVRTRIKALIASKSMPTVTPEQREQFKEQEKQGRKLAHWNNLLQTGIPSVIADVERQARAQGYVVIDGQISEVDF